MSSLEETFGCSSADNNWICSIYFGCVLGGIEADGSMTASDVYCQL